MASLTLTASRPEASEEQTYCFNSGKGAWNAWQKVCLHCYSII